MMMSSEVIPDKWFWSHVSSSYISSISVTLPQNISIAHNFVLFSGSWDVKNFFAWAIIARLLLLASIYFLITDFLWKIFTCCFWQNTVKTKNTFRIWWKRHEWISHVYVKTMIIALAIWTQDSEMIWWHNKQWRPLQEQCAPWEYSAFKCKDTEMWQKGEKKAHAERWLIPKNRTDEVIRDRTVQSFLDWNPTFLAKRRSFHWADQSRLNLLHQIVTKMSESFNCLTRKWRKTPSGILTNARKHLTGRAPKCLSVP